MTAHMNGLRLRPPHRSYPCPDGIPLRAVQNRSGTTMFVVVDHSALQVNRLAEILKDWNARERRRAQIRRRSGGVEAGTVGDRTEAQRAVLPGDAPGPDEAVFPVGPRD
jgi:hypothetical protein